jgi:hypothetical protein
MTATGRRLKTGEVFYVIIILLGKSGRSRKWELN